MTMSGNTSPTPHSQAGTTIPTSGYDLPDDSSQPGKIITTSSTSCSAHSSPSPRGSSAKSSAGDRSPEVEVIETDVPIIRSSLPTPEPKPIIERNGLAVSQIQASTSAAHNNNHNSLNNNNKAHALDHTDYAIKKPPMRDVDEDSCLIKCVYFTQQCCECVIM